MIPVPGRLALLAALAFALDLLPAAPVRADDWTMLGGHPDRNSVSPEKGLPVAVDAEQKKNLKWDADLGKTTYSTPVISGGRIFIGTNNERPRNPAVTGDKGVLMCFQESDGAFQWQAVHDKLDTGDSEDAAFIGLCSTPAVVGDSVYYVSNRNELVSANVADGRSRWILDMRRTLGASPHQGVASSPLVVGDLVFVVTGQGVDFKKHKVMNPKAPSFIAVERATGKVKWQDSSPGAKLITGQWSSPSYAVVDGRAQVLFPGGDGWLYSFDPASGTLLWKFNCKAHEKAAPDGTPETPNQLVASAVVAGHRVIIATGIDTDTGGPGCLRAIDARKSGDVTASAELWRHSGDDFGCSISTVAVHDGLVYAVQYGGILDCFDLETGKRVWQHDMLSASWSTPLVADGKVYVSNGDGELLVFQAGREKKLLSKNGGIPGLWNGSAVAASGVLYIAGRAKLYAFALGK